MRSLLAFIANPRGPLECTQEADVLTAVYTGRWPGRASSELRAHVEGCAICRDLAAVAGTFEDESDVTRFTARVPDSSLVWWRAQMRAREDAAREAVRPITVAQAIGFAAVIGVAGAVFGATAAWFQRALSWMWESTTTFAGRISMPEFSVSLTEVSGSIASILASHGMLIGGVVLCLLLAPLAVYLTARD